MPDKNRAQVVIVGAGPGGYPAAFHAADMGMDITLIDPEENPGGVCLYRGCVPSKALLHVASFLHTLEMAPQWGISVGQPEVDAGKLNRWKQKVVGRLTGGLGQLVKQRGIRYVQGRAMFESARRLRVQPHAGETYAIEFEHAIVATGSEPATVPGMPDSRRVMTSRQALDVETIPERLLVIGGGYIGLELGQVYASLGSAVTLVEMLPDLLAGADRDLVRHLKRRLDAQFDAVLTETTVTDAKETEDGIQVQFKGRRNGGATFDKILLAVGRKALTKGLGLEQTGVTLTDAGIVEVDSQRRTAEASIFAIGDVSGEPMLAHKATHEARVAIEAIAGKRGVFEPRAIPFVVFSDPEIAWCGVTEAQARESGRDITITSFPWSASGRATTLSRNDGLTKVICDADNGRILGVGITGHNAGELLGEAVLAMEMGAVADDLALTIHTHPTLSETLMEACQAFSGHSTHYRKDD